MLLLTLLLGYGVVDEFKARNGIVTKEQQRSLDMSAELARQNAERQRQHEEEHKKKAERNYARKVVRVKYGLEEWQVTINLGKD